MCVILSIDQNCDQEEEGVKHHLVAHIDPQTVAPQPTQHPAVAAIKGRRQAAVPHIHPGKGSQQKQEEPGDQRKVIGRLKAAVKDCLLYTSDAADE